MVTDASRIQQPFSGDLTGFVTAGKCQDTCWGAPGAIPGRVSVLGARPDRLQ